MAFHSQQSSIPPRRVAERLGDDGTGLLDFAGLIERLLVILPLQIRCTELAVSQLLAHNRRGL